MHKSGTRKSHLPHSKPWKRRLSFRRSFGGPRFARRINPSGPRSGSASESVLDPRRGAHARLGRRVGNRTGRLDTSRKLSSSPRWPKKTPKDVLGALPKFHRVSDRDPRYAAKFGGLGAFRRAKRVLPGSFPEKRPSIKARIDFAHLLDEMNHLPKEDWSVLPARSIWWEKRWRISKSGGKVAR